MARSWKRAWLARFLDLKDSVPSHDRFHAILAAIRPAEFEKCLPSWITALHEISPQQGGHSHGERLGHGQLPKLVPFAVPNLGIRYQIFVKSANHVSCAGKRKRPPPITSHGISLVGATRFAPLCTKLRDRDWSGDYFRKRFPSMEMRC